MTIFYNQIGLYTSDAHLNAYKHLNQSEVYNEF